MDALETKHADQFFVPYVGLIFLEIPEQKSSWQYCQRYQDSFTFKKRQDKIFHTFKNDDIKI